MNNMQNALLDGKKMFIDWDAGFIEGRQFKRNNKNQKSLVVYSSIPKVIILILVTFIVLTFCDGKNTLVIFYMTKYFLIVYCNFLNLLFPFYSLSCFFIRLFYSWLLKID